MYVMPLRTHPDGSYTVFWEETSLVGKDDRRLSFEECKKRAYRRLQHHGINVLEVEEEEYCYIPMGGEIPDLSQRGTTSPVHPHRHYELCVLTDHLLIGRLQWSDLEEQLIWCTPPPGTTPVA